MAIECDIGLTQIVGYLSNELDSAEHDELQAHFDAGCPSCQVRLDTMKAMAVEPEPQQIVAQSLFDTQIAQPVGVRGAATLTRRRIFEAESQVCVDIDQQNDGDGCLALLGQVLIKGADLEAIEGTVVKLLRNGQTVTKAEVDIVGDFEIPGVEPGIYNLKIVTGALEVTLANFDVG